MTNSITYNFDDFTLEQYKALLDLARSKYSFIDYQSVEPGVSGLIWRHDVDFSIPSSLELARIEADHAVKATYFIQLNSEFYNVFAPTTRASINEIITLNHSIGLHFDISSYAIRDTSVLISKLQHEKRLLEDLLDTEITVFSFHNPDAAALSYSDFSYGGMINTYGDIFRNEIGYCSDSNGIWRFARLHDVLEKAEHRCLHVLTHPAWWTETIMSPRQRIMRALARQSEIVLSAYDAVLADHGRENIDW